MPKKEPDMAINFTVENLDSALLEIPREDYQKPLNEKRVAQIVAGFDENIANEPKVSYRDGRYFVFDGQHTVAARIMLNGGKKTHQMIRCKVYRNLTAEQEALLFAEQTGFSAKPTPGDRLRAKLYAKDKEAIEFKKATEKGGFFLDINGSRSENHIRCINTMMKMHRKLTTDQYSEALFIVRKSWKKNPDALLNEVLVAVCEFVHVYYGQYDRTTLTDALSHTDPKDISRSVKSDFEHPGYRKFVFPVFEIYNNNCGLIKLPVQF